MRNLSNVTIKEFIKILEQLGYKHLRDKGGHIVYSKEGQKRPIIIQSHISPIPEFIIKNNLREMGINRKDFIELLP